MKTAYLLFGLAACASTPAKPHSPLYGASASGNIGQIERATPSASRHARPEDRVAEPARPAPVPAIASSTHHSVPPHTRVLVGASARSARVVPTQRPLVDHREDVVCGNIVGKGTQRVCRDEGGHGRIVSDSSRDPYDPFATVSDTGAQ